MIGWLIGSRSGVEKGNAVEVFTCLIPYWYKISILVALLTPSFPYFLPSPFPTYCAILPTSFGGKGLHLRFSGVSLSYKANARRSVESPQDHFIITLIISNRRDWRDTRGKWPLARNPDRSWWHRHAKWKFFFAAAHGSIDKRQSF